MSTEVITDTAEIDCPYPRSVPELVSPPDQRTQARDCILIVDDEDAVAKVFAELLRGRFDCYIASNAQEALNLLNEREFSLVISDVYMPGLSGIELLRKIVSLFPDVAVIIVSGVDRTQRVIDALRLGAFDYLLKPCDLDVLQLTVDRALERRALLQNGKRYKRDLERHNLELTAQKEELLRLQAQLIHSEKMASIGQLAAGIAHELNNPAGFICSNMESLSQYTTDLDWLLSYYDGVALPPDCASQVATIKKQINYDLIVAELQSILKDCHEGARRIYEIVLNLRTFSRLDEAELKHVDLHAGIDATIRLMSQYFGSNKINVLRDYGDLPLVECYAGQINQVWMNLLTNAAQAIGERKGEVRIETALNDGTVIVKISDTGEGIAPGDLERIFDPFFTTKSIGVGTGLGLSISYGIIARHGGSITVESTRGKGTTFTTMIPRSTKHRYNQGNTVE